VEALLALRAQAVALGAQTVTHDVITRPQVWAFFEGVVDDIGTACDERLSMPDFVLTETGIYRRITGIRESFSLRT